MLILLITIATLPLIPSSFGAEQEALPPGMTDFSGCIVPNVLQIYKLLTNLEMITDSRVKTIHALITLKTERPMTKEQASKLIEKALLEQTGIVITRLDHKRASVTYNDALPIHVVEENHKN
jgi:ACT domain-containing protein